MKVLAFYPALNPVVNDIVHVLVYLLHEGHQVQVITARQNKSKSTMDDSSHEIVEGLPIHRIYPSFFPDMLYRINSQYSSLRRLAQEFNPDLLLCSQEFTSKIGLETKRILGRDIPIVVVSEFAGDLADRGYSGVIANLTFPLIGIPRGKRFWPWLSAQSEAVITCYPGDIHRIDELATQGTDVLYVPWCNQLPKNYLTSPVKDQETAVYIGNFSRFKNTDSFINIVPAILECTPTNRMVLVGCGKTRVVETLRKRFGRRIKHYPGLSRTDALQLMSEAYYGISPIMKGGWGFIGDCWAVKTPLVCISNDYQLNPGRDAIVSKDLGELIEGIKSLYSDTNLYKSIQEAGFDRYVRNHTSRAVGSAYDMVLRQVASKDRGT